jgi:hypothetical protein
MLLLVIAVALITSSVEGRNYSLPRALSGVYYSKAAYCDAEQIAKWNCGPTCTYHANFTDIEVYSNSTYDSQTYVGYNPTDDEIVVAFRGSSNLKNWIADFTFNKVPYPNPACKNCHVHDGFYTVYLGTLVEMNRHVATLAAKYPTASIFVTGHSLGAAVSILGALDFIQLYPKRLVSLYNYGEPRVGDPAFVAWACTVLHDGQQHRLVHNKDPVPHLPPIDFGFLHAPQEIWYKGNTDKDPILCDGTCEAEDPHCSDSIFPDGFADHTLYLGICMGCTCEQADLDRLAAQARGAAAEAARGPIGKHLKDDYVKTLLTK